MHAARIQNGQQNHLLNTTKSILSRHPKYERRLSGGGLHAASERVTRREFGRAIQNSLSKDLSAITAKIISVDRFLHEDQEYVTHLCW